MRDALGDDETRIVDPLYADNHTGETPVWVDRLGHTQSTENLPFDEIMSVETHTYLPADELAEAPEELELGPGGVITYCHAGNAANSVPFLLALMGHEHVSIYDGSLREGSADPSLPIESSVAD